MNQSIWKENIHVPAFSALEGDLNTDVLILGGGLTGLLCAAALKEKHVDCVVLEANEILSGTSGNTTAKITSQHGLIYAKLLDTLGMERARLYWEANEAALAELRRLCGEIPCDFEKTDNYIYSRDSVRPLDTELEALQRLKIPARFARDLPLPFPVAGAVCFPDQAQFHPGKLAVKLAESLRIYTGTPARKIQKNTVLTDRGTVRASKIIVATHFPILNRHGGYFLKMYQQRSYVLALQNAGQVHGMYLDCQENGLSFRNQGDLLLLGGGGHRTGKQGSGWAELTAAAAEYYPGVSICAQWAAQDCMTLDGMPYIGRYSQWTPELYTATGFNKWGMTSAMLSAMILRDLILEKENPWAELFAPDRPLYKPQLVKNIAESTVNLLTPMGPRCTHLGCRLIWNPQEHSWDCPCHGSRYDREGRILDDPAVKQLDRKKAP